MVLIHVLEDHCSYHSHPFLAGYTEKRIHRHTSNADMSDMLTRIAYRISGNFGIGKVWRIWRSWPNRQTKTTQNKAIAISASIFYFNVLYEHCIE